MSAGSNALDPAVEFIHARAPGLPALGLILGSGLGDFADSMPEAVSIPAADIPNYPSPTVEGHKGRLVFGKRKRGDFVLAFQGRTHFYESGDADPVLFPIRLAQRLGISSLVVTNAAGGINRQFAPGDLMVIADQINLTFEYVTPINGKAMNCRIFDDGLIKLARTTASSLGINLKQGVYAGVKGPSYETAAEIEMIARLGGDAVGMSTVLETVVAWALGMRVLGISCITNKATGIGQSRLSHSEVTDVANRVKKDFTALLSAIIESI